MSTTVLDTTTVRRRKQYPKYKASHLDWLPQVPAHWQVIPLKRVAKFASGENITAESITPDGDFAVFGGNGLRGYTTAYTHSGHYVLIGRQGALCGNINYAHGQFWASEHAVVVTPRQPVEVVWLGETLRTMNLGQHSISSAQPGLSVDRVIQHPMPVPPLPEQQAIAAFVDQETAGIDALIGHKERLITLLEEKRQAVISHAVTHGLDSTAPMKDSGVPFWGQVPSHWQMTKLRHLVPDRRQVMYGIVLPGPHVEDGIPIVKGGNCEPGRLRLEGISRTTREIEAGYERSRLREGDIVYAIRGSIGAADIVPAELNGANLTQDAARIAIKSGMYPRWLLYTVRSLPFFAKLDAGALGATIRGINIRDLKRADLPCPGFEEQASIAEFLDQQTHHFDSLTERVSDGIARLQEYRTALISAAVTGQIDVRGEV